LCHADSSTTCLSARLVPHPWQTGSPGGSKLIIVAVQETCSAEAE